MKTTWPMSRQSGRGSFSFQFLVCKAIHTHISKVIPLVWASTMTNNKRRACRYQPFPLSNSLKWKAKHSQGQWLFYLNGGRGLGCAFVICALTTENLITCVYSRIVKVGLPVGMAEYLSMCRPWLGPSRSGNNGFITLWGRELMKNESNHQTMIFS